MSYVQNKLHQLSVQNFKLYNSIYGNTKRVEE